MRAHRGKHEILAVGRKAKALIGRAPESLEMVRPLRDGVIADFVAAEAMLRHSSNARSAGWASPARAS